MSPPADAAEAADALKKHEHFLGIWRMRMNRSVPSDPKDLVELMQARARGLGKLTRDPQEQRRMIKAARESRAIAEAMAGAEDRTSAQIRARAERLEEEAREMFILCHRGYVESTITRHMHRFDSESPEMARDVLQQACNIALHTTIDRYDFSNPANPLTYANNWMQHEIKSEAESGRRIRLKSNANMLGDKIEQMAKKIESEGRQVTVAELAEKLEESPERIAEILPHARRQAVRLDAPIPGAGNFASVGALIEDPKQMVEAPVIEEDARERLVEAMDETLSPYERKVVEVAFGMGENEDIEQKDLFDGVYVDSKGNSFSAKASVIREREKNGEKVQKMSQRELNELYKNNELSFKPGNPEAHALARAAKETDSNPGEKTGRILTYETGIPPTSGTVQDALKKGLEKLSESPKLQGLDLEYRGPDQLENSERARETVRQELLRLGAVRKKDLPSLQATRSATGKKSKLRTLAEKHGLIDPESGQIRPADPGRKSDTD